MIEDMSIEVVYTAESTASGGGRDGHVKSTDGKIDLDTRPPKAVSYTHLTLPTTPYV